MSLHSGQPVEGIDHGTYVEKSKPNGSRSVFSAAHLRVTETPSATHGGITVARVARAKAKTSIGVANGADHGGPPVWLTPLRPLGIT